MEEAAALVCELEGSGFAVVRERKTALFSFAVCRVCKVITPIHANSIRFDCDVVFIVVVVAISIQRRRLVLGVV